jgi:endonuclease G
MARKRISGRQWIYILLTWVVVIGLWWVERHLDSDPYKSTNGSAEITEFPKAYLPAYRGGEFVSHDHYLLSYIEKYEQAAWVAYALDKTHLTGQDRKRPYYIQDPDVRTGSADWRNYKGSGYDRGHLCPAGDRKFSETAYNQTFYTSNISPQDSEFNAGIWNELEQQVRRWARRYDRVYVITGGVLHKDLQTIGTEGVAVPDAFYKVVIRRSGEDIRALGFLIPNSPTDQPVGKFILSLDELEALSGLDFFADLSEPQQESLEKDIDTRPWGF